MQEWIIIFGFYDTSVVSLVNGIFFLCEPELQIGGVIVRCQCESSGWKNRYLLHGGLIHTKQIAPMRHPLKVHTW